MTVSLAVRQALSIVLLTIIFLMCLWHHFVVRHFQEAQKARHKSKTVTDETLPETKPDQSCLKTLESTLTSGELMFPLASHTFFIAMLLYSLDAILTLWGDTLLLCEISSRFALILALANKAGLYMYLFVRARVTVHVVSRCYFRFLVVFQVVMQFVLLILSLVLGRSYDSTTGCILQDRLRVVFGTGYMFTDFFIGISLFAIFFRPLMRWFKGNGDEDDISKNIRVSGVWAIVAVLTTLVAVVLALRFADMAQIIIEIDQVVNGLVIIQQYEIFMESDTMEQIMIMSASTKTDVTEIHSSLRNMHVRAPSDEVQQEPSEKETPKRLEVGDLD